jgi:hypothetical protein
VSRCPGVRNYDTFEPWLPYFNNGGRLPGSFVPLFGLTGSNLTSALSQLSGEAATGAQRVGFQLTDQFLNLMLDPFVDGRSGVGASRLL